MPTFIRLSWKGKPVLVEIGSISAMGPADWPDEADKTCIECKGGWNDARVVDETPDEVEALIRGACDPGFEHPAVIRCMETKDFRCLADMEPAASGEPGHHVGTDPKDPYADGDER